MRNSKKNPTNHLFSLPKKDVKKKVYTYIIAEGKPKPKGNSKPETKTN